MRGAGSVCVCEECSVSTPPHFTHPSFHLLLEAISVVVYFASLKERRERSRESTRELPSIFQGSWTPEPPVHAHTHTHIHARCCDICSG